LVQGADFPKNDGGRLDRSAGRDRFGNGGHVVRGGDFSEKNDLPIAGDEPRAVEG
jgi:hypothetical protein